MSGSNAAAILDRLAIVELIKLRMLRFGITSLKRINKHMMAWGTDELKN